MKRAYLLILSLVVVGTCAAQSTLTVAPGDDLQAAVRAARDLPAPVTILLADGLHVLPATLQLGPADSGLRFAATAGAAPVLSGGRPLTDWTVVDGVWETVLPEVAAGTWRPRQLWVDGQRATLARSPNAGFYRTAGVDPALPRRAFFFEDGQLDAWPDLTDGLVTVLHSWESARLPLASVDPVARRAELSGDNWWDLGYWSTPNRWYVEGLAASFDQPGEWHLDTATGLLRYRPLPGQTPMGSTVIAGRLPQLVRIAGEPRVGIQAADLRFEGLTFAHADDDLPAEGRSDPQAACSVTGAVELWGARGVEFVGCRFTHTGGYGLGLRQGSQDCRVERCEFVDTGAGGLRLGEITLPRSAEEHCSGHTITNNWVHDYGRLYYGGVGIWLAHANDNIISHNEIADGHYTGISIGWNWQRGPTASQRNQVLNNHIHHLVNGMLSDAGGIYTLGDLDGTVLRGNHIHDLFAHVTPDYSWGIYLDAESHGVTVENNLVYAVEDGLMLHNGAYRNTIRNNVFAGAADWLVWRAPGSIPELNEVTNNVFVVTQGSLYYYDSQPETASTWDHNLFWRTDGQELLFMDDSFAAWQALGLEQNSIIADPGLGWPPNLARVREGWPEIGLAGFDPEAAGLVGPAAWTDAPRRIRREPTAMPASVAQEGPREVVDDFEAAAVGSVPAGLQASLGGAPPSAIVVTDEQAASGARSLRLTDQPGLEQSWQPHAYWQPNLRTGTVRASVRLRLSPGAQPVFEWRTPSQPFATGPSLSFSPTGHLLANGQAVAQVPADEWLTIEIDCPLGPAANGTYQLRLRVGDGPLEDLGPQTCQPEFRRLGWVGLVMSADSDATVYLDDLSIRTEP